MKNKTCGSCAWCDHPRLPVNKKKYGEFDMCLCIDTKRDKVKAHYKGCRKWK